MKPNVWGEPELDAKKPVPQARKPYEHQYPNGKPPSLQPPRDSKRLNAIKTPRYQNNIPGMPGCMNFPVLPQPTESDPILQSFIKPATIQSLQPGSRSDPMKPSRPDVFHGIHLFPKRARASKTSSAPGVCSSNSVHGSKSSSNALQNDKRHAELEKNLADMKKQVAKLKESNEHLMQMSGENYHLQKELEALRMENKNLKAENVEMKNTISELRTVQKCQNGNPPEKRDTSNLEEKLENTKSESKTYKKPSPMMAALLGDIKKGKQLRKRAREPKKPTGMDAIFGAIKSGKARNKLKKIAKPNTKSASDGKTGNTTNFGNKPNNTITDGIRAYGTNLRGSDSPSTGSGSDTSSTGASDGSDWSSEE